MTSHSKWKYDSKRIDDIANADSFSVAARAGGSMFGMRSDVTRPIRLPPTLSKRQALELVTNGHCGD